MMNPSLQNLGLLPMDEDIEPDLRGHPSAYEGPSPVNYAVLCVCAYLTQKETFVLY